MFVYFNNDPNCAAVHNAVTFAAEVQKLRRSATRVPARRPQTIYDAG
jgi:uncharacterized protein YecE (DUF72 family)